MTMRRVLLAVAAVGVANLVVFIGVAVALGGDAVNGKIESGRYFLSSHGHLTEVSADVYTYSLWHVRSIFVTQPVAMLAAWIASRTGETRL